MKEDILIAFSNRSRPLAFCKQTPEMMGSSDLIDVQAFEDIGVDNINGIFLNVHYVAFCHFTPEAFIYFLPSVLIASKSENNPHLLAVDLLLEELSGYYNQDFWDDRFFQTWGALSNLEIDICLKWLNWLASLADDDGFYNIARSYEVLSNLLKKRVVNKTAKP